MSHVVAVIWLLLALVAELMAVILALVLFHRARRRVERIEAALTITREALNQLVGIGCTSGNATADRMGGIAAQAEDDAYRLAYRHRRRGRAN